jgi:hypothetical protein
MYGADGPDAFWLNFTNIALGLVTLACVMVVVAGLVGELRQRLARRAPAEQDDHAFATPGLGMTMADGGERIDQPEPAPRKGR